MEIISEEKMLSNLAIGALVFLTVVVELVMTYGLLWLNAVPMIVRGYWLLFYVPIVAWIFLSVAWCYTMFIFINRKRRRKLLKRLLPD